MTDKTKKEIEEVLIFGRNDVDTALAKIISIVETERNGEVMVAEGEIKVAVARMPNMEVHAEIRRKGRLVFIPEDK